MPNVPDVEPEERQAPTPMLADAPQHGAVAAQDNDQVGIVRLERPKFLRPFDRLRVHRVDIEHDPYRLESLLRVSARRHSLVKSMAKDVIGRPRFEFILEQEMFERRPPNLTAMV